MLRLPFIVAALLLALPAEAERYGLTWRLGFDQKSKTALGSLELGAGREQLRTLDFEFPEAYSDIRADGTLERKGKRVLWTPPEKGGTIRWRVRIDETRDNGAYRSYFPGDWAIFRGDRVFPRARVRALKGAQSRARLILEVPESWHLDTPYLTEADGSTYIVDDPDRGFDRPVGWMLVGDIGTRREVIAGTEVSLAAPKDEGMRRMDMLAFLNFTLPAMKEAYGALPEKILIVSAPDPMWRGGLSAPQSLYLHLDRPMISENATSTLLHELTHVITRIRGEDDEDDWLAEGLAEYYAVELLYRSGGMTEARHQRTLDWLADWGKNVKSLRAERSSAETTARAALLLVEVDKEIRKATDGNKNFDDVTRKLMRERKVSTAEFIEISEKVAGRKLKSLDSALLR
jgi:predicted metalloprotease with PDZ domain